MMKRVGRSVAGLVASVAAVITLGVISAGGATAAPGQFGASPVGIAVTDVVANGEIVAMGGCGQTFNPDVPGAKAYWQVECTSTQVRISGWVEDTRADGKCAKVKATFDDDNNSTFYSSAACPKGERESFTSSYRRGNSVSAYLYTYDV
ncbi:hypothetical protein F4560_008067 [Saccharothrix ecbatanensis]|uniref:Secreted protein n=1 Tax=Saccharothrix ecbatanensis TaxID=1105145 RepID=A0A7W9HUP7_9PSEU|nr:hypothetical protein [Saccharothrix ecbatanensis]MBB5808299.1 hypothetical protein [Saccharothrix ecbatanensis]